MSPFEATAEQRRAITHPLEDLCVVAGAGSGKTAVLTARYARLVVEHGLDIRRVAALTFTEKAAAEMKGRIARALDEGGRRGLAEDVEFAPISTIHGFCARLLRLHAIDAGVDPAFRVLDEAEARLLREDATRRALEEIGRRDPDQLAPLVETPLDADALGRLLQDVREAGTSPSDLVWHHGVGAARDRGALEEGARLFAEAFAAEDDAPIAALGRAALAEVRDALDGDAWALLAAREAVIAVKYEGRRRGRKAFTSTKKALAEALGALAAAALDERGERVILPALRVLLGSIDQAYAALREEQGALDFTDLEREAIRLLERLRARGRRIRLAPRALLVDEMQDTNPLQARLIALLRGAHCPLFSVGDPKQSIYRFRGADVRVLEDERDRAGEAGAAELTATFRARPGLVAVLNELTRRLFADGKAGVAAGALVARGSFYDGDGPDVEMIVVDAGAGVDSEVRREAESRWIARRIRDLLEAPTPRLRIERGPDDEPAPPRPLSYRDVAILFRARSHLSLQEEALRREGIPFVTHRGRGFFQAPEIVDLVHVLRTVHDPADDHAFACFLTGPACAVTDDDLLRYFAPKERGADATGRAWEVFTRESEAGGAHEGAWRTVERLRREAAAGRLGRVVEGALFDLGLLAAALLLPEGDRRAMNLRKIVGIARKLERGGRHDLGDLLRHLETLRDLEIPEAEAATGGPDEDAVRLLTVHAAKGLEFPVVVLADVGRKPPNVEHVVLFDRGHSLATKIRHPLEGTGVMTAGLDDLREREKRLQEEEDRRLLYVAMTRAEERLVIVGSCAGLTRDDRPKELRGWGRMLFEAVGEMPERDAAHLDLGEGVLRLARVDAPPERPEPASETVETPASGDGGAQARHRLERAREDVAPLGDTPFVVTVSELLAFARSPAGLWRSRHERERPWAPDPPAEGDAADAGGTVDEARARARERAERFDEHHPEGPLDRAALGRALHAVLERLGPSGEAVPDAGIDLALETEFDGAPPEARPLLLRMVERFRASGVGRRTARLLAERADVRREVAFHARIRFPRGARVAGFEALLVRGAIDLWLPGTDGAEIVDYKTNAPGGHFATPEAVAAHYAPQLRLYALAAERLLGSDVAGARIVLLDPEWGDAAPEVEVDVRGAVLEDARRLCQAYALACFEDRWPADWRALLAGAAWT